MLIYQSRWSCQKDRIVILLPQLAFPCAAESDTARKAVGVASARALASGGAAAQAVARAYAVAIAIYGCPGVKPTISSEREILYNTNAIAHKFYCLGVNLLLQYDLGSMPPIK